jgi:hypothetical protein
MNIEKLKACIVYACHKAAAHLDGVKLNKVMWYTDTASYMERGSSVTEARYIRKPRGPVAGYMASAIIQLEERGIITTGRRFDPEHGVWLSEFTVHEASIANGLTAEEKGYLDHAIKRVSRDHTSHAISERTHGEIWELAAEREEIPLYTMFAERAARITEKDILAFAPAVAAAA